MGEKKLKDNSNCLITYKQRGINSPLENDWSLLDYRNWHNSNKEYLTNMVKETINARSVNCTGISFDSMYPGASNFALFNNERSKNSYKEEFYHAEEVKSHLLFPYLFR